MSHEITATDAMVSIREKPWHGLGDILDNDISVFDARQKYLTWNAHKTPLYASVVDKDDNIRYLSVPNKFGVLREDNSAILGVVGSKYEIYQNSDMWDFIEIFHRSTNMKIETAGSLKGGKYTWILLRGDEFEVVKGDPINKYFLFRNSFTGTIPVSTLFTNIRVVCNNTLNLALNTAKNIYNVKHVSGVVAQVSEVEKALNVGNKYQSTTIDMLTFLANKQMTESSIKRVLEEQIFTLPIIEKDDKIIPIDKKLKEKQKELKAKRDKKVNQIMELIEVGNGSDLKGVKGTAYGVLQALIEWEDHDRLVKTSIHKNNSIRFENAMYTSADFKTNALQVLLKAA